MMVTLEQVKSGVALYIDREIMSRTHGLTTWFIGAGLLALPSVIDKKYCDMKPLLVEMNVATADDCIDLDVAEKILMDVSSKYGKVTETIGGMSVSFTSDDVQQVIVCIKSI